MNRATALKERAVHREAKHNLKRFGETLGDLREDLAVRQEATIPRVCAMETRVKEVINSCGVSTSQYVARAGNTSATRASRRPVDVSPTQKDQQGRLRHRCTIPLAASHDRRTGDRPRGSERSLEEELFVLFGQDYLLAEPFVLSRHGAEIDAAGTSASLGVLPVPDDAVVSRLLLAAGQRVHQLARDGEPGVALHP